MSALSDLQKKLEQEAKGIMFPFNASASNVSTTQNVYDSATDGIMTMQGQKYVGPDAVIQYGSEEQGFPRQLKEIEAPMLPQFDATQFPKAGEGIMQTPTPAPTTPTTPVEPVVDPCPPGYKLINGVCQLIEQQPQQDRGGDRPTFTGPKIENGIIEGFEDLSLQGPDVRTGAFYERLSPEMKAEYDKALTYQRGIQVKFDDKGNPIRIVAHSPTLSQLAGDAAKAIGEIIEGVVEKGPIVKQIVDAATDYFTKDKPTKDFGELAGANTFGQLQRNIKVANLEINAATEALQQIANSTKYREQRTDEQIDNDIRTQQRKIDKARQTIEESNDMLQGTSQKEDRERAAQIARDINRPEEIARKAAQRKSEKEARAKQGGFTTSQQRTKDFEKLSKDLSSFRKNIMKKK